MLEVQNFVDGRSVPAADGRGGATGTGRSSGPTASGTGWHRVCGPGTTGGRCGWRSGSTSGVWMKAHIPLVAAMPHGGFKKSGYGKDLSVYGFEDYTRIKHVMSNIEG